MRKFFIFLIIVAAAYAAVKLSIKSPDQTIPSATEETSGVSGTPDTSAVPTSMPSQTDVSGETRITPERIEIAFTGYGPGGKIEHGSVKAKESTLVRTGGVFSGGVVFDMNTITSVPVKDQLITHLKSDDFFNVAVHPTAVFTITSATQAQIKGTLTMKGITKEVTLPISHESATGVYSSTVRVNMEAFGIKQTFTDKEFLLEVSVK